MRKDSNRTDEQYAGPEDGRRNDTDAEGVRGGAVDEVRGVAGDEEDEEFLEEDDDLDEDEDSSEGSF